RVCVRNSLGVFRRSTGGSLDNSRTVNPRAAQGARTPNILSSSSVVIEISCGAAAWVRKGGERVLEEVRPPALISRDSAAEKPEAGWAAEAVEACLRLVGKLHEVQLSFYAWQLGKPESGPRVPQNGRAAVWSHTLAGLRVYRIYHFSATTLAEQGILRARVTSLRQGCLRSGFSEALRLFKGWVRLKGIDIISLAAGCAVCIRINPARIRPAGNGSRFPCTETHRLSTGREMAPRAHKAAGRLDYHRAQAEQPLAARQCLAVPHLCLCFRNPPGRVRPGRKLKANSTADEARTFYEASLQQRFGGTFQRTARAKWGGGRRGHRVSELGPRRNAREGTSPSLFLANFSASVRKNSFQAGLKKAWDQLALPRAEGAPPGEPPAQPSSLTSKPHVNNLPLPALQTSPRGAALGGRGPDAEPARKAACRPAQPSLDTGLR
ncbi:hypothetical protein E2I00_011152, partial [Balaenoptera physalus]